MTLNEVLKELNLKSTPFSSEQPDLNSTGPAGKLSIGIMKLRSAAKKIGRDSDLAHELWNYPALETKVLSTLTEEIHSIKEEKLDDRVKSITSGILVDNFVKNVVAKTPFLFKKANEWTNMRKPDMVRRAGYECVCNLAKLSKVLDNNYFEKHLIVIEVQVKDAINWVKEGQCKALIAIGSRNKILNIKALNVAQKIGVVTVNTTGKPKKVDPGSILMSDRIQKKL